MPRNVSGAERYGQLTTSFNSHQRCICLIPPNFSFSLTVLGPQGLKKRPYAILAYKPVDLVRADELVQR